MDKGKNENFIMLFANIEHVFDLIDNSHCDVWNGLTIDESLRACEKILETGLEDLATPHRNDFDNSVKIDWIIHGDVVATYFYSRTI